MKALTLRQPWATLVAIGAKKIETRSWKTSYRGPLAIHAGATRPRRGLCNSYSFREALQAYANAAGRVEKERLPRGAVIAVCELMDCTRILNHEDIPPKPECSFGGYWPGRYMWCLSKVRQVGPFPAKGRQGLWEWDESLK